MNIVQVIPALNAGGAERTIVDITRAIVEAGGAALTITSGGRMEKDVLDAGGQIAHLPVHSKNPVQMWRNVGRIANIARDFRAHLIHARSRAPAWSAYGAAKQLGLPFVTTYHGAYSASGALKRRYNAIMASGDTVIANSHFTARHIIGEHNTELERICIIARGVDPVFFDVPEQQERPASDEALIVLPARLTRLKGHALALEALLALHKRNCPARLVFAGDAQGHGAYIKELHAQISRHRLENHVSFCGHVTDMAALYARADIVLCASTEPESFGRTLVEAQASARIALGPAHGGSAETITDGQTGFHFIPGDADDMANALHKTLGLEGHAHAQICLAARKHAGLHYSCETMCAKTLGVYRHLIHPEESRTKGFSL